jgi:hypothetical protein
LNTCEHPEMRVHSRDREQIVNKNTAEILRHDRLNGRERAGGRKRVRARSPHVQTRARTRLSRFLNIALIAARSAPLLTESLGISGFTALPMVGFYQP